MKFSSITFLIFLVSTVSLAQVNMTKYASDDLFKVEPVMIKEVLNEVEEEEEFKSFFHNEIEEGLELWNTNQLEEAIEHFRQMSQYYPETSIIHYYLGSTLLDNEAYDEAIEEFETALSIDPLFLESKFMIGLTQIEKEELSTAKKTMETLVNVPLYASYGYYGLGVIALEEEKVNPYRAKKMYEKCLKEDSTFKEAYIPLTYIDLALTGNLKPSIRRMNRAVSIDSTWQQARIIRAMLAVYKDNDLDQFENDIDVLILQDPNNYHYYSIKAYLSYELKDYRNAVENFRLAYNLEIDTTRKGDYKFSTKLKRDQRLQAGLNYYHNHFDEMDTSVQNHLDKGICDYINNERKQAQIYFQTARNKDSNSTTEMFLGIVHESHWNRHQDAIKAYDKALIADSTNYMVYSFRGDLHLQNKNLDQAFKDYSMMIKLRRKSKDGYKKRGNVYFSLGDFIKSYRDYSSALGVDTTDTDLYFNRAHCAYLTKYYDQSIFDLAKVIHRNPSDGDAYYLLYQNHLKKSDTLQSIAYLDSASKYSKYKIKTHKKLLTLSQEHEIDSSIQNAYDRLVKYSRELKYRLKRATYHYERKEYDKALIDLNLFLKKKKDSAEGYYYLGQTLMAKGEIKSGNKALNKATKLGYKL